MMAKEHEEGEGRTGLTEVSSSRVKGPRSVWREKDSIDGRTVDAMVVILDGPGCSHAASGGCTMCGYNYRPGPVTDRISLMDQVRWLLSDLRSEPYLKIFTSGSFLDTAEIPVAVVEGLLKGISERSPRTRVLVESRPEFITEGALDNYHSLHENVEIAIGLESSSDRVRDQLVQKGFGWDDFRRAGEIIIDKGFALKTYLLLKPPFLGEHDAYLDMMKSISDVHGIFPGSRISVNPMNIQVGTPLEALFQRGLYRPPWLWTVLRTLEEGKHITGQGTHLMSCPTAGGKRRGAHNCGECDQMVLETIERFSLDNTSPLIVPDIDCCKKVWEKCMYITGPLPLVP